MWLQTLSVVDSTSKKNTVILVESASCKKRKVKVFKVFKGTICNKFAVNHKMTTIYQRFMPSLNTGFSNSNATVNMFSFEMSMPGRNISFCFGLCNVTVL